MQSCCWCSFSRFTCFGCCLSVWFVCWCVGDVVLFCLVLIWPLGLDRRRSSRHCCSIFFFFFVVFVIYIISAVCWYILERSEWVLFSFANATTNYSLSRCFFSLIPLSLPKECVSACDPRSCQSVFPCWCSSSSSSSLPHINRPHCGLHKQWPQHQSVCLFVYLCSFTRSALHYLRWHCGTRNPLQPNLSALYRLPLVLDWKAKNQFLCLLCLALLLLWKLHLHTSFSTLLLLQPPPPLLLNLDLLPQITLNQIQARCNQFFPITQLWRIFPRTCITSFCCHFKQQQQHAFYSSSSSSSPPPPSASPSALDTTILTALPLDYG